MGAAIERGVRFRRKGRILGIRGERPVELTGSLAQKAGRRQIGAHYLLSEGWHPLLLCELDQRFSPRRCLLRVGMAAQDLFEIAAETVESVAPSIALIRNQLLLNAHRGWLAASFADFE